MRILFLSDKESKSYWDFFQKEAFGLNCLPKGDLMCWEKRKSLTRILAIS